MKRWLSRRLNELLQYQRKYRIRRLIRKGMISVGDYTYGVYNLNVKEFRGNVVDLEIGKFLLDSRERHRDYGWHPSG